ncbi:DUF2894 domain-containing protein [Trinickia mobilis]|uniref:DUF2894 domain-containing protein n=1 Tax=Trinickia mobilis TaxID=2816356 RepID=UPI001A8E5E68|nr:DUF2894 domain-containing protein [Trinickia mobilis]
MSSGETLARATLDAWRERGADRLDPVRFRFIEALDRRASGHRGEARRILDERLSTLLEAYASDLENAAAKTADADHEAAPREPRRGALGGLIDSLASRASAKGEPLADNTIFRPSSLPEPELLDYFRETWSKLSTERQLRQSEHQVPKNAGPLNSSSLVHRSLSLMRELSPGYLQQFLSYVDALSSVEQMNGGAALTTKDVPRGGSAKKSARSKPR